MIKHLVIGDKRIELLDREIFFEEGESILIETDGSRQSYKVTQVVKVMRENGKQADCILEVHLRG